MESLDFLSPYFLGPYGENDDIFEKLLLEFFRDHVYWRRNFHPEDLPPISTLASYTPEYIQFESKMRQELHKLTAALKSSVPVHHPRYMGHMVSDMLMPGLIAQLVTTLYNPNNINAEIAPVTLKLELEVGVQLAKMFGFNTDSPAIPKAWGHLTSGGTTANYEGVLNIRAAKFYPFSLRAAIDNLGIELPLIASANKKLTEMSAWELFNLSIDEVLALDRHCFTEIAQLDDEKLFSQFQKQLTVERVEHLGLAGFMRKYWQGELPVLMVPVTAHYSWEKAMKSLGFGSGQIVKIAIDDRMRMDSKALDKALASAHDAQQPVLGVIGVLGSTEFGAIDPIHEIIDLRKKWRAKGLDFSIHVDAAWGGYISTLFRDEQGGMIDRDALRKEFKYFPSQPLYSAYGALSEVDSVTVDPHKMGFMPFGVGAFVARNREITRLFSLKAPYVFDDVRSDLSEPEEHLMDVSNIDEEDEKRQEQRFNKFGQWIVEGSKPGSTAAAAYVTHAVLPLNHDHMGRIIARTVLSSEYFYDRFKIAKAELKDKVNLVMPIEPDTNLVAIMFNPVGNRDLVVMNRYSNRVYEHFRVGNMRPVQVMQFLATHTLLYKENLQQPFIDKLMDELKIDQETFEVDCAGNKKASDHLFVLRHTTMNPWLQAEDQGENYIDRYFEYLKSVLIKELDEV